MYDLVSNPDLEPDADPGGDDYFRIRLYQKISDQTRSRTGLTVSTPLVPRDFS